jgi:excisionase family DNA binding protein
LEKLKSCRAEEVKEKPGQMMKPKKKPGGMRKVRGHIKTCEDTKIIKDTSNVFITKDMKTSEKMNQSEDTRQSYTVRLLANLLGKSERTLQEWAEKGKIPAVRVGVKWCFPKEEIDRLLLKGKDGTPEPPQLEEKEKPPEIQKTDFSPENQGEPEKGV